MIIPILVAAVAFAMPMQDRLTWATGAPTTCGPMPPGTEAYTVVTRNSTFRYVVVGHHLCGVLRQPRRHYPLSVAYAVWVLGHEASHVRHGCGPDNVCDQTDETLADCEASTVFMAVARKVGIRFRLATLREFFRQDRCRPGVVRP